MESENTTESVDTVDLFEVFRLSAKPKSELDELDFAKIRATYTRLVPFESKEQLKDCNAVAILPKSGHIVVDKNKFEEMFKLRVKNQVSIVEEELMEKNAKYVSQLKAEANDLFNEERAKIRDILKVVVNQQFEILQKSLQNATDTCSDKPEEMKKSVEEALQEYKRVIDVVLSSADQNIKQN